MKGTAKGGWYYTNAVMASDLPQTARHIAHVLAARADSATGNVKVSLSLIAAWTGMDRTTVARRLNVLEAGGWVVRSRPDKQAAIKNHETTAYTLVIPPGYRVARASGTEPLPSGITPLGVVAQSPELVAQRHTITTATTQATNHPTPTNPLDGHGLTEAEKVAFVGTLNERIPGKIVSLLAERGELAQRIKDWKAKQDRDPWTRATPASECRPEPVPARVRCPGEGCTRMRDPGAIANGVACGECRKRQSKRGAA